MHDAIGFMARLMDCGGDDDEVEFAISTLVEVQRERVIMEIRESGDEFPVPVEKPFEWEVDEYIGPEDLCYRDDLSGRCYPRI